MWFLTALTSYRELSRDRILSFPLNGKWELQIMDKADCISHSTNTLGKGMNPVILPPAMGK